MLEWLYKTPEAIAADNFPDEQEHYEDLIVRRPDLIQKRGFIPLQEIVSVELPAIKRTDQPS